MSLKLNTLAVITVATAGTRVQVSASSLNAYKVFVTCPTGVIYVGDSNVSSSRYTHKVTAAAANTVEITGYIQGAPDVGSVQLSSLYVDAGTNGDKAVVGYLTRLDNG